MRRISLVSVARSDYGIYLPILRQIQRESSLELNLIAGGMHLSPEFGLTAKVIEADGFQIGQTIEMLLSSDTPEGTSKSIGLGLIGFAQAYTAYRPDILVVLGDRFEMYAAALAALPFKIPVAHIHGGELTQGAIDDALRHSMTKLSHIHFPSTQDYAQRIIQLGEEPWRVVVSGAPGLDNLHHVSLLNARQLAELHGLHTDPAPILVTFHPVTLEYEQTGWQCQQLLAALESLQAPIIFTLPNADAGGREIIRQIEAFVQAHPNAQVVANLGTQVYFSLMAIVSLMIGNSSSGIIEAASFNLPVVNIGSRQAGRTRASNVIDVDYTSAEICHGIRQALTPEFRRGLQGLVNPFGDGHAAERIVETLKTIPLDERLLIKKFYDLPTPTQKDTIQ